MSGISRQAVLDACGYFDGWLDVQRRRHRVPGVQAAVWHDGEVVGWITSGGYAHYSGVSLALGYIPTSLVSAGSGFEIEIIGRRRPAAIRHEPVLDPQGLRMRA